MSNAQDESPATERALPLILSYLSGLAKNSQDAGLQDIAVVQYSSLLYNRKNRQLFWKQRSETVTPLIDILRKAAGFGADSSASLWSGNATTSSRGNGFEGLSGGIGLQLLYHVLLVLWQLSFEAEDIGDDMNEYETFGHVFSLANHVLVNTISSFSIPNYYGCRQKRRLRDSSYRRYIIFSTPIPAHFSQQRCLLGCRLSFKMSTGVT
jgi:hypothetical protein